ncbi:E3 ubiquitin-protein ligase NRDP1-like [Tubulanus polymorphus]|uniref:E3 ubiquitin-protein ligase NRDP1-like n=1 Tax=Tubulanus polymorphus TaxID=672921 RepID=UPI003DA32329
MGYELNRFQGEVEEELLCPICSGVLEDPLQVPPCEHAFCAGCIREWLTRMPTCPVDRNPITSNQLKPAPRITRTLLSKLNISCDNCQFGCTSIVKLDMLQAHLQECDHNPKKPVHCDQGCGLVIPKDELKDHNCVRELRNLVQQQQCKISDLQAEVADNKLQLVEQRRDIQHLKEYMRTLRYSNPRIREIQSEMENDDVLGWVESLQAARVTRWGGMISTPDTVLQAVIKRALIDSHCPTHIVSQLMENAHERTWPPGLSTLETRQLNRRQYENYVTKRIPGKQAVIVMSCENTHMSDEMILEPGLVMIFAHGVE